MEHTIKRKVLRQGPRRQNIEIEARKIKIVDKDDFGIMKGHNILWSDGDIWTREEYAVPCYTKKQIKYIFFVHFPTDY